MKRRPLPARRRTPRRRRGAQWTAEEWAAAGPRLQARCRGMCERCGERLSPAFTERHHRRRRRDGGDHFANLLVLCTPCHQWVHAHPREARDNGWIVPASGIDPANLPVRIRGHWWLLNDDGTASPAP